MSKDFDDFYESDRRVCKECIKERVRNNYIRVGKTYDNSYKGVIRVLYKTMKRHQKLRPHEEDKLPFTKQEFKIWLEGNNYKSRYEVWVGSGYDSKLKPSVDRLNDFEGYSFDNMRLVTWEDNRTHQKEDILSGTGTSGKRCCNIGKYSKDGKLLKTYISYQEVRREEGYCVHYPLKNSSLCKNGFIWKLL